ncbi:MAG: organic hydroperoxide resistance protein [Bacteroidota bacterium]
MIKTVLYTAQAQSAGGRSGHISSDNGVLSLPLNMKNSSDGTNPEQLFAAGYAACFESTLQVMADRQGIKLGKTSVNGQVELGTTSEGGYEIAVRLEVSLPELESEDAENLTKMAHENCPYSKATRGNIDVNILQVNDEK